MKFKKYNVYPPLMKHDYFISVPTFMRFISK